MEDSRKTEPYRETLQPLDIFLSRMQSHPEEFELLDEYVEGWNQQFFKHNPTGIEVIRPSYLFFRDWASRWFRPDTTMSWRDSWRFGRAFKVWLKDLIPCGVCKKNIRRPRTTCERCLDDKIKLFEMGG